MAFDRLVSKPERPVIPVLNKFPWKDDQKNTAGGQNQWQQGVRDVHLVETHKITSLSSRTWLAALCNGFSQGYKTRPS
jgi:hypothetical protein